MSAAPPTPPPHRSSVTSPVQNGQRQLPNGTPATDQTRPLLHLQDIIANSDAAVDPHATVHRLLETANYSLRKARSYLEYKRLPDWALLEFFVAATIVYKVIPNHKDSPAIRDHRSLATLYGQCVNGVKADEERFSKVKEFVKADNEKTGVVPQIRAHVNGVQRSSVASPPPQDTRPRSVQTSSRPSSSHEVPNQPASQQPHRNSIAVLPANGGSDMPQSARRAPPVQPKPQGLHGSPIRNLAQQNRATPSAADVDDLSARFAKLSNSGASAPSGPRPPPPKHGASYETSTRPNVSINSDFPTNLPKQPSPTYSPARAPQASSAGFSSNGNHEPAWPQTSRSDSLASSSSLSYTSMQSSYQTSHSSSASVANPSTAVEEAPAPRRRRQSAQMPQETQITAERLFDYMRTFKVLLIDVRSREEYDDGHIFSQSVICVEPIALRAGMSAEELVESLCISPDDEPELFERRDQYDLVVFYDQKTETTGFLTGEAGSNVALKYLYDTLQDYNQEKPLHWPPILLSGGLNAWIDLLGSSALQMSSTAASKATAVKPARPIARRPPPSNAAKINVLKRHREYNPLAPEEERKWRERARSESIVVPQPPVGEEREAEVSEQRPPENDGYEDFDSRYPNVATVEERYAMASGPPPRPSPAPPRIPNYPDLPVPTAPSRPPPAVPRPSYSGVSERSQSLTSTVTKSSQLAPYIPPKLKRLPRTGMHNFGVTCYMNATIQCLSATIPLTDFFFDGRYKRFVQQDNWKGSKGLMPELYNTLLTNLWRSNDGDTIRPTNFRKFCARLNREWGIDRQQDAKEFLEFLIDTLHEDFNIHWSRNPLRALNAEQEAARELTPPFFASKMEWERYCHRDYSQLTELFGGQHISRLQCTICRHSSTTYEAFYSISVEIPSPPSKSQQVDIHDCLRSYCSAERLSKEDYWRCPNCKTYREATKRITITRVPQFLVIHFKRFSASHSERARKVHTAVDFPLTGLDLKPYVLPPPEGPTQESIAKSFGPEGLDAPHCMTPPYKYDAYAVMRHLGGTMTSGHYISLVEDKARGCWREFNDDRVNDFKPEQLPPARRLQNEQAYIVFYQRVP